MIFYLFDVFAGRSPLGNFLTKRIEQTRQNVRLFFDTVSLYTCNAKESGPDPDHASICWEITSDLFVGTVSSVFSPNMFKKQDGMLAAFFCTARAVFLPRIAKNTTKCSPFSPEKNRVRPILLYCVVGFLSKYVLKNRTECPPFLVEKMSVFGMRRRFSPKNVDRTGRNARPFYLKNISF